MGAPPPFKIDSDVVILGPEHLPQMMVPVNSDLERLNSDHSKA
jgi:hypothetical protein